MVVVAPGIHLHVLIDGNAAHIGGEHLAVVDEELHAANAIVVVGGLHVVVSPEAEAHLPPSRIMMGQLVGGKTDALLDATTGKHALALLRICHQGMALRRLGVLQMMAYEIERVEHLPRLRVVNLEMKMGSR